MEQPAPAASPPPQPDPEPSPQPETVKLLCDLGIKRHDLAERSYDALNTRLAALFAFNGFLVPASIGSFRVALTATEKVPVPPIHGYARLAVLVLWCIALGVVGVACVWGYIAQRVKSLPNALTLYRDFGARGLGDLGPNLLVALDTAWKEHREAITFKGRCLNAALLGISLEVTLLVMSVLASL